MPKYRYNVVLNKPVWSVESLRMPGIAFSVIRGTMKFALQICVLRTYDVALPTKSFVVPASSGKTDLMVIILKQTLQSNEYSDGQSSVFSATNLNIRIPM